MYTGEDWFSQHIPVWTSVLAEVKGKPIKALEIGSFEGRSSVWLLENILTHSDSTLTCVDPHKPYSDLNQFSINWADIERNFRNNIAPWKEKVTHIKKESSDCLPLLEKEHFDFIYVDGGHTSAQCLVDGVLSHLLLKKGGIIIFDDYLWSNLIKAPNVPKSAIDAFMECFAEDYDLVATGYQVILKKK